MKRISVNPRFVNNTGDGLVPGKIHTIRQNYDFWKTFEGQDVALFTWEGKAYRSNQIVFCTKHITKVQRIKKETDGITPGSPFTFYRAPNESYHEQLLISELALNDGFLSESEFIDWFLEYPDVYMALIQFTDFKY
jgi:hypothetical protein